MACFTPHPAQHPERHADEERQSQHDSGAGGAVRHANPQRQGAAGALETTAPSLELVFTGRSSAMYVWGNGRYQVHGTENY